MTPEERRVFRVVVARFKEWRDAKRVGYETRSAALKALSQVLSGLGWTKAALHELDRKRR